MFTRDIKFLIKYIEFRFRSKPRGGHGIHSPFVYELYTECIDKKQNVTIFENIETLRIRLLNNHKIVSKAVFGAIPNHSSLETISKITKRASIHPYLGRLLYRLTNYLKPTQIIELGTSLGISTMYIASANRDAKVISIEGDENLANLATANFNKIGLTNVSVINGDFDSQLSSILCNIDKLGLVFIDGNHSEEATLRYFKLFSAKADNDTLIIFDDIRWSQGMENAWNNICNDSNVSISIDLFNCGLVFFRKGVVKQHFNLRYGPF